MLTEDERQHIKLEEQYRSEVRAEAELGRSNKQPNPIWQFVNSAFGLWLFSAVFLTGVGSQLARRQAKRAEEARTRELVERLDLETSYRLSQVLGRLDRLQRRGIPAGAALDSTLDLLVKARPQEVLPLYPEFSAMSLPAVIAELRRHVPTKDREELDWALSSLTDGDWTYGLQDPRPDSVAARLLERVVGRRAAWTNTNFPYMDCSRKAPFC